MKLLLPSYHYSQVIDPYEEELRRISYSTEITPKSQKVLLVIPPSPQIPTPGREFLVTGPFEGFAYIATLVKKMGYNLKVVDCRLKENLGELVLNAAADADIISIATYADSFVFLENITKLIKETYPEKFLLLGGPLVTSLPEVVLQSTNSDAAILGEGELTMIELFQKYFSDRKCDLKEINGLAFKKNGKVYVNPPRAQINDLDNLPLLDYSIWENKDEIVKNGQILISSTRGCTQLCSFCFKTIPGLRLKSIERFEEEVAYLKKETNFNYTWLNDLTFNVDEKRAIQICDILKKYNVRYHVFARVVGVSPGFAKKLKETGCLGIWFGFESCDQYVLDYNRKNIKYSDIENALKISSEADLAVRGLFIVGLYKETEESLKKMLDFIKSNKNFLPLVKYLVPFPGTSLFYYALNSGKIEGVTEFLRMLSRRKIKDNDDEIINITCVDDEILRKYFHEIWETTKERETQSRYCD